MGHGRRQPGSRWHHVRGYANGLPNGRQREHSSPNGDFLGVQPVHKIGGREGVCHREPAQYAQHSRGGYLQQRAAGRGPNAGVHGQLVDGAAVTLAQQVEQQVGAALVALGHGWGGELFQDVGVVGVVH